MSAPTKPKWVRAAEDIGELFAIVFEFLLMIVLVSALIVGNYRVAVIGGGLLGLAFLLDLVTDVRAIRRQVEGRTR